MTFETAIGTRNALENTLKKVSSELKAYPRSTSGLTKDSAKDARWFGLRREAHYAHENLRHVNKFLTTNYKKELREMRELRRA